MAVNREKGHIGPLTLPALIHALCGEKLTGTLIVSDTMRNDPVSRTLYFDSGGVVFATSTDPEDRLGILFLRQGMISLSTLTQAADASGAQGKRLGTILVQKKAIRPEDLVWGVAEQVKRMIVGLFSWTRGEYAFTSGPLPSNEVITLKMPTGDLIMNGIKSVESWSRISAAVGGLSTRYATSPAFAKLARGLTLGLEEWTLLSRCESGATLGRICEESPLKDFEVCRLIWAFMVVGLLNKAEAGAAQAGAAG